MKILLISYYFPPCGGAAVQRWLRFSRALVKQGHSLTVITTQDGDYPYRDESLLDRIPSSVKILRSKPLGFSKLWMKLGQNQLPYGSLQTDKQDSTIKKLLYWLRLNLVVPDLRIGWNPSAFRLAEYELKLDRYDYVITTGPPHSTHLIGLKLKRKYGNEWRTDFRDPMSEIYYLKLNPPARFTLWLHRYLERQIIKTADLNYIVSFSIATKLPKSKKVVLYNGFDPDDFMGLSYMQNDKFRIKFAGQLTAGQNPQPLLNALSQLPELGQLEFSLIGTRNFPEVDFECRRLPFLPHRQAMEELVQAELLVLLINNYEGNQGMLTTKLFEYIGSRTPVLCLGAEDGEAAQVIRNCQAGVILTVETEIIEYVRAAYQAWKNGTWARSSGEVTSLDVNNQVLALTKSLSSFTVDSSETLQCVE